MHKMLKGLGLFFVILICVGFFLPWVKVESKQIGSLTKLIVGKEQKNMAAISGFQVPIMANSSESRLILTIAKIFKPGVKDVDKKSFLVYGVPVLGIMIFLLSVFFRQNKWINMALGILGLLIFSVAVFKIKTTDLEKAILQVRIGFGMWLILYSYLGLGALGLGRFVEILKKKGAVS